MKYMNIFNVKHGDFGVYYDTEQDYSCTLDCGTSQQKLRLHTCCLTPKKLIDFESSRISSHGTKDILISHYHNDHFGGISAFKRHGLPFFRKMYLPYIDFKAAYTKDCIYAICLLQATAEAEKLRIPFTLFRDYSLLFVDNYANNYIRRGKGDQLEDISDCSGVKAEVLWPPKRIDGDSKGLKKFIDNLEGALHKPDLRDAIQKTETYFSELDNAIQSRFPSLDEKSQNEDSVKINEICSLGEPSDKEGVKQAFKELKDAVKGLLNALSIVFRINNKLVWMGDVTWKVITMLNKDLKGDIEWFKLPHHGTIDISNLSIKSSKFLVSLSDGRRYTAINKKILEKACKDNTIIVCTDGHKDCHNHFLPFICNNHSASGIYSSALGVYCSRNTIISIDL